MKTKLLLIVLVIFSSFSVNQDSEFSFPPEWSEHEAIWTDFASEWTAIPNQDAKAEIIASLSKYVKTKVVYDSEPLKAKAISLLREKNAVLDSIIFIKSSSPMNWIRDPGPLFVSNGEELRVIDFKWNCYGNAYDCTYDYRGTLNDELSESMGLSSESIDIYLEGGGIEVSSNSIIAYKAMALQRNPDRSIKEVEDILLKAFGKKQVIWLDNFPLIDKPLNKIDKYFGTGANGHIDVTTRFLNDSTILATVIAEEDKNKSSILKKEYEILQSNLEQLKLAKQPNGKPYNIVTVEAPDYSLYEEKIPLQAWMWMSLPEESKSNFKIGEEIIMLPALEYANFLISNRVVLVSEYWKEGMPQSLKIKDEAIKKILKTYFPDREIIGLDVLPINWGGGGIHCRTQQEPKIN